MAAVRLKDGQTIEADLVLVGIGILPSIEPLFLAGADVDNGILVDGMCRSSLTDIYAIGDCAAYANDYADGAVIRLESVQNATDIATNVDMSICSEKKRYCSVPWFCSNQYDVKLQTVGLSINHDNYVVRGKSEDRSFSVIYLKYGRVTALDSVNALRDYAHGRYLVMAGSIIEKSLLANTKIPLIAMLDN